MTVPRRVTLQQLASSVLARRAGPDAGAEAIAASAERAYDDLARVLAPVIGDLGVKALTDRALHIAARDYAWLVPARDSGYAEAAFAEVVTSLKQQDPAVATDAAAAVFAAYLTLLATFIGESLATRLVQQAWSDGASSTRPEET